MFTNYQVHKFEIPKYTLIIINCDAHKIMVVKHTPIMPTTYHVHKLVICKYTMITYRNYDAHKIMIYKHALIMHTNHDVHKIIVYRHISHVHKLSCSQTHNL